MKSLSLVALLAAVVYAGLQSSEEMYGRHWHTKHMPLYENVLDKNYEQNKEYLYEYNGQLMTGIPQSSEQHSATRIQALVKIIFKEPQKALMKIEKVRFGYFNDKVAMPRYVHDFDLFEQVPIEENKKQIIRLPVEFSFEQGLVQDMYFTEDEQPWSANIKRAVLNLLQVNINKQRRLERDSNMRQYDYKTSSSMENDQEDESIGQVQDFFTVMENTMEGECETAYTIVKTGEEQVNVTKTINFNNCPRRPDIRYNHRFHKICPTCEQKYQEDKFLQASTVIRQQVKMGENRQQILVKRAETESLYTVVPLTEEGSVIQTYVLTQLTLIKKQEIEDRKITSQRFNVKSDSGLIYTPDWDIVKEKYFLEGDQEFHRMTPYSEIKGKIEFMKSIVEKLVHYMRDNVEEEAPRQFVRLVKTLRLLKKDELEQVMQEFFFEQPQELTREEQHKVKAIMIDALAAAGTHTTVEKLVELIKEEKMTPLKAGLVIRKLQTVRVISEKMLEQIWDLTSEEYRQKAPVTIYQAAYLTVGSLLNGYCQAELDKLAVTFKKQESTSLCSRQTKQRWTEKLVRRFEECQSDLCRVTVLKAMGNAGLDQSVHEIEKIINNRRYSPLIRTEAILALRQLLEIMPRKLEKVLMPIYMNCREQPVVRMTAFFKLIQTQPDKFIIDQLTHSLFKEPNKQVAAFAYTTMQRFANDTNPCLKRMADDLKLSLRHARALPVNEWMHKSQFRRVEFFPQQSSNGFMFDLHSLMPNNSFLPQDVAATLRLNVNKQWYRNAFQVGIMQQNVEQYLRHLVRKFSHNMQNMDNLLEDVTSGRWSEEQTSPKFRKELTSIFENLDIDEREEQWQSQDDKQSLAYLYFRIMNQDYAFLPLTKEILPEHIVDILSNEQVSLRKLLKQGERLLKDQEINMPFDIATATQVHELMKKIPTTIGLPLVWNTKAPVVAQARGHLKVKIDRDTRRVEIELIDFKPSSMITYVSKVETWSPIVNSGLKLVAQKKMYAPITMKLVAQLENNRPIVKVTIKPTEKKFELIRLQSRPVTLVRVWPTQMTQYQEPEERTIQGEQWTRMLRGRKQFGEKSIGIKFDTQYEVHTRPTRHIQGTPQPLFAGPNKIVVRVEPGQDMPREIEFTVTGWLFNKLTKTAIKPEFDNFHTDSDEFLQSSFENSQEHKSHERYYKQYESQEPTQHQIKITVEGKGSSVERRAEMVVDCRIESTSRRAGKCELQIKRTPVNEEQQQWQLKQTIEFLYPEEVRSVDEIAAEKKLMVRVQTQWGEQGQQERKIDLKVIGEQSRLMQRLISESLYHHHSQRNQHKSLFTPVAQYEHVKQMSMLDQYKIEIDHRNVNVQLKNWTEKALDLIKAYYYQQTTIDHQVKLETSTKGQLRLQLNIDPVSRRSLNFTVEMPNERVCISDVPLSYEMNGIRMQRMSRPSKNIYELMSNSFSSYNEENMCKIRSERVETFDQVKYMAPISTCYSLIAKDCTRESKFAVLIKRLGEQTERKQMKIVSRNVQLIVKPTKKDSSDRIQLEYILNGEKKNIRELEQMIEHGTHEILSVTEQENGYSRIVLPEAGIRVYFDGYSANVKVSRFHGERLCGLCGQLEPEHWEEECQLRDANNECVDVQSRTELRRFFQSYVLDKEECSSEQQKYYQNEDKYEWQPLQWEQQQYESDEQEYLKNEYSQKVEPVRRTRVIEQLHEVCFSKQPVIKCPKNTQPTEHKQGHVKVIYTCLDRNDFETEEYLRQANQGRLVNDVEQMPASFTQSEKVPLTCEKIEY